MIYLIDRYYDPSTDQFLSVDPDLADTGQPYAFTGDDPLNATDPLGLKPNSKTSEKAKRLLCAMGLIVNMACPGADKASHPEPAPVETPAPADKPIRRLGPGENKGGTYFTVTPSAESNQSPIRLPAGSLGKDFGKAAGVLAIFGVIITIFKNLKYVPDG